jgi:hypothetical protein
VCAVFVHKYRHMEYFRATWNFYSMPRVGFNLTDKTAPRLRQFAVKKTGSMKGLSQIGEEAFREYPEKHENESEKNGNPCEASA